MPKSVFLYLLVHATDPVVKIGTAIDVRVRIRQLPDEIDVEQSRITELPEGKFAVRLEKFLHTFLKDHNNPRPHGGDGYTEWYDLAAFDKVVDFIERNHSFLRCSAIHSLPRMPSSPARVPLVGIDRQLSPEDKWHQQKKRRAQRDAECAERNRESTSRLMDCLTILIDDGAVVGWFGKYLVLWSEDLDQEDRDAIFDRPILSSARGSCSLFQTIRGVGNGLYLMECAAEPSDLISYFARFDVYNLQPLQNLFLRIPCVPNDCVADLDLLTKLDFFELLDADERNRLHRRLLEERIVSRVLATIIEDRQPVPNFEQHVFAFADITPSTVVSKDV